MTEGQTVSQSNSKTVCHRRRSKTTKGHWNAVYKMPVTLNSCSEPNLSHQEGHSQRTLVKTAQVSQA